MIRLLYGLIIFGIISEINSVRIVFLPDTQGYILSYSEYFTQQTYWCCKCFKKLDIDYLVHLGDIVQHAEVEEEWKRANYSLSFLSDCGLNYSILPGNHDFIGHEFINNKKSTIMYDKWIAVPDSKERFDNYNTFNLIDDEYAILSIQYIVNDYPSLHDWINRICDKYSNYKIVLATHYLIGVNDDDNYFLNIFFKTLLKENCNIIVGIGGHVVYQNYEFIGKFINKCYVEIPLILCNYQAAPVDYYSTLKILEILNFEDERNQIINLSTYNIRNDTNFNNKYVKYNNNNKMMITEIEKNRIPYENCYNDFIDFHIIYIIIVFVTINVTLLILFIEYWELYF